MLFFICGTHEESLSPSEARVAKHTGGRIRGLIGHDRPSVRYWPSSVANLHLTSIVMTRMQNTCAYPDEHLVTKLHPILPNDATLLVQWLHRHYHLVAIVNPDWFDLVTPYVIPRLISGHDGDCQLMCGDAVMVNVEKQEVRYLNKKRRAR